MAEFAFNNKVHTATKSSLFKINYRRELRIGFDIRKKEKNVKAEEFVKEMKDRHEEAKAALVKSQEEMKRQADRNRKEAKEYRVGDKVLISIKDFLMELMERATKKLTEKYIGPYVIKKIMSENAVELELLIVVATTRRNGTCSLLTSAKLSVGYLVVGITRELNKEPSLHCSLL